jgi:hypothetical protein
MFIFLYEASNSVRPAVGASGFLSIGLFDIGRITEYEAYNYEAYNYEAYNKSGKTGGIMAVQAASLFVSIGANIEGMLNGMAQANGSLKKTGDSMSAMGAKMSAVFTVPLTIVGRGGSED